LKIYFLLKFHAHLMCHINNPLLANGLHDVLFSSVKNRVFNGTASLSVTRLCTVNKINAGVCVCVQFAAFLCIFTHEFLKILYITINTVKPCYKQLVGTVKKSLISKFCL